MKTIISTSGTKFSFNAKAIKELEDAAKKCYNESINYSKESKGLSNRKAIRFDRAFKGCKGEFQYYTQAYVVSYKRNLFNEFKGYNFKMQFLKNFEAVPAGTILKW